MITLARLRLTVCWCAACLLSSCCTVERVLPPVRGSVVDAVTGAPIQSANVTIKCFSERTCQTDSQGHFGFKAKYELLLWVPPSDPAWHFTLTVEADGYAPSEAMTYHGGIGLEPQPGSSYFPYSKPGGAKMVYDGKVIVIDPIALSRGHPKDDAKQ